MKRLDASLFRDIDMFSSLTDAEIQTIMNAQENSVNEYVSKNVVFKQDYPGTYMYIVMDGFVDLFVKGELGQKDTCIATKKEGEYFGENVAMTLKPVTYTATAITGGPATLFRIDKKYVVKFAGNIAEMLPPDKVRDVILKIPLFKALSREEIRTMREWAPLVDYKAGSYIYEPNKEADNIYVVQTGRVELSSLDDNGNPVVTASEGPGEYFGEEALLPGGDEKHHHFAKAVADARLICIPKHIFKSLLERDPKLVDNIKMVQNLRKLKMKNPKK